MRGCTARRSTSGRDSASAPGPSAYHAAQQEFLRRWRLTDRASELRVAAASSPARVYGVVTRGWRQHSRDESMTPAPGAGAANNPEPVLGRPTTAAGITRDR